MNNLAGLHKPWEYACLIREYAPKERTLVISLRRDADSPETEGHEIHFSGVIYFEGTLVWRSADLSMAPRTDREYLINKIRRTDSTTAKQHELGSLHLYTFQDANVPVRVLARNFLVSQK